MWAMNRKSFQPLQKGWHYRCALIQNLIMKKEDLQNAQQGSGSAENRGDDRNTQKNTMAGAGKEQQEDLARQAGLGRDRMTSIEETGAMSGRDDDAGGDGEESNEETD